MVRVQDADQVIHIGAPLRRWPRGSTATRSGRVIPGGAAPRPPDPPTCGAPVPAPGRKAGGVPPAAPPRRCGFDPRTSGCPARLLPFVRVQRGRRPCAPVGLGVVVGHVVAVVLVAVVVVLACHQDPQPSSSSASCSSKRWAWFGYSPRATASTSTSRIWGTSWNRTEGESSRSSKPACIHPVTTSLSSLS